MAEVRKPETQDSRSRTRINPGVLRRSMGFPNRKRVSEFQSEVALPVLTEVGAELRETG